MIKPFPPLAEFSYLLLQFGFMDMIHSILVDTSKLVYICVLSCNSKLNAYFT